MVPSADLRRLCIICDWGNWIFPFDDMFDNGKLSDEAISAQLVMFRLKDSLDCRPRKSKTTSIVGNRTEQAFALVELHDVIFDAIITHCSTGESWHTNRSFYLNHLLVISFSYWLDAATKIRYVESMHKYCVGTLAQVFQTQAARTASFEKVLGQRRQSVCVTPLLTLVELGHKINLPNEAFDNVYVRHLEQLGVEITLLHNDLLSYFKEEEEGVPHNTVMACRLQGMGAQEAMTFVGDEASRRVKSFEETVTRFQESDPIGFSEVVRYVKGIEDVVRANLYWSFKTERFLSKQQKDMLLTDGTLAVSRVISSYPRATLCTASSFVTR
jgi:hypothetical protein